MVRKLLVTTALEDTWKNDVHILFLGEWCKIYTRKHQWESLYTEVLPYHWDDRKKAYDDYNYISQLYEKLLIDLAHSLNEIHHVDQNIRYWRIVVGPWLAVFLQILYDRWFSIKNIVVERGSDIETIILNFDYSEMVPLDMEHFNNIYSSDEWNHFIYGRIISECTCFNIEYKSVNNLNVKHVELKKSLNSIFKKISSSIYSRIAGFINGKQGALFITTYLSLRNQTKLSLRFRQLPVFVNTKKVNKCKVDINLRKKILSGSFSTEFEKFFRSFVFSQIPIVYLEGYSLMLSTINKNYWPLDPKIIFTSNSISSDDFFKFYAAENVSKGASLLIGQHGGHYGTGKWSFYEDHEVKISDRYLTWGWQNNKMPKISPVGIIKVQTKSKFNYFKRKHILMVTTTIPRYSYWMYSAVIAGQWLDYFEDQNLFVDKLRKNIRKQLIVRLYSKDYEWCQYERWKDAFPDLLLDKGIISIDKQLRNCRLYVSTYNATTYLESLTKDIPTVIFWNPIHWELREDAIPFYNDLKKVGIFHESPESAAFHVNKIWDDIESWWYGVELQEVKQKFCKNYCFNNPFLIRKIETILREKIS